MTETKQLTKHIQGKVIQLDYDFITALPDGSCTYCLSDKHVQMILGIADFFGWSTRWYSEDGLLDTDIILDLQGGLVNALMNGCCGDEAPILFRWTVVGILEISIDNGTTWTPSPERDPRNYSPQYPPIEGADGSDKKCLAATGMSALIKEQVGDNLTDDMGRYTLGQLLTDWVKTVIETSNPFEALLTIATNQIFALVIASVRAALTTEVYHKLTCIFDCNMGDDASFTNAQWAKVRADILSKISGIAGIFLEHLVFLLGVVGLTNLARSQAATTGDCDDCCPSCVAGWEWGVPEWTPTGFVEGEDYIEVNAYPPGNGYWYWPMKASDSSLCCDFVVTGTFDPATTSFCARYPCGEGDANFGTEGAPWINDAFAAPHGEGVGVMVRANYAFTARITFP